MIRRFLSWWRADQRHDPDLFDNTNVWQCVRCGRRFLTYTSAIRGYCLGRKS